MPECVLGIDPMKASVEVTNPGIVYKNFLIVVSRVPEGYDSTPGQVDPDLSREAAKFMFQNLNSKAFIFVLTMSLCLKAFFFKRYMLSEYIAVAFYLNGVYSLLATLNTIYMKFINPEIQFLAILVMWAYFIFAMILFFEYKPVRTGIKSAIAFLMSWAGYFIVALSFSYLIVLLKQ